MDTLREEWTTLTELADSVKHRLLTEQRLSYEREVDKQVRWCRVTQYINLSVMKL